MYSNLCWCRYSHSSWILIHTPTRCVLVEWDYSVAPKQGCVMFSIHGILSCRNPFISSLTQQYWRNAIPPWFVIVKNAFNNVVYSTGNWVKRLHLSYIQANVMDISILLTAMHFSHIKMLFVWYSFIANGEHSRAYIERSHWNNIQYEYGSQAYCNIINQFSLNHNLCTRIIANVSPNHCWGALINKLWCIAYLCYYRVTHNAHRTTCAENEHKHVLTFLITFFRNCQYFDVIIAHIWIHWKNSGGKKEERKFTINTIYCTYFFAHNLLCVLYNIMPSIYWVPFFIPSMKTIWAMIVRTHNEATRRFIYKIGCWFSAAFDKWTITKYSTKKKAYHETLLKYYF